MIHDLSQSNILAQREIIITFSNIQLNIFFAYFCLAIYFWRTAFAQTEKDIFFPSSG